MKRNLLLGLLAGLLLIVTGCSAPQDADDPGVIPFIPFFNEDLGIQGIAPLACSQGNPGTFECGELFPGQTVLEIVQQPYPGPKPELISMALAQLSIEELPAATGSTKGAAFTWDLYQFEAQLLELGPTTLHLDLALAEDDERSYFVAMVTLPDEYDAHPVPFDIIFQHAVYSLSPYP